jgi:hypothetical protein
MGSMADTNGKDAKSEKLTPKKAAEWQPIFLTVLRDTANVRLACQKAGISRPVAYKHRNRSSRFAAEWDTALAEAVDVLEAEARRRGLAASDTLLIFLLKAHRPEVYRETIRHDHAGYMKIDLGALDDSQLERLAAGEDPAAVVAASGRRTALAPPAGQPGGG